ncbi:MAG: hypothetical protein AABY54_00880 [Deltaproteobacteria bacterium]
MKQILAILVVALLFGQTPVFAETKEIIAEGTYNMGDGETPTVAESRALLQAKRIAVEEAGLMWEVILYGGVPYRPISLGTHK